MFRSYPIEGANYNKMSTVLCNNILREACCKISRGYIKEFVFYSPENQNTFIIRMSHQPNLNLLPLKNGQWSLNMVVRDL